MLHCVNDYYRYFLGLGLRVQGTVVYLRFLGAKGWFIFTSLAAEAESALNPQRLVSTLVASTSEPLRRGATIETAGRATNSPYS